MDQGQRQPVQDFIAVNKYAGKKDFVVPQPASEELKHNFDYISLYHLMPGNIEIEAILKKMGKTRPEPVSYTHLRLRAKRRKRSKKRA